MEWTNEYNLPERVIRLLPKMYQPKKDRLSVTQLIDSPLIRTLQLERWDYIVRDYSDLLSTIIGMSVHERNERLALDDELTEHKMEDEIHGVILVGKYDSYKEKDKAVRDTKTKGVNFASYDDAREEIEKQLNLYAWQLRKRDKPVELLEADIFYRDWKLWEAMKDVEKWAVMRPGRKNALKLFTEKTSAEEWMFFNTRQEDKCYIQHRLPKGYPQTSYQCLQLPLWTQKKAEKYIKEQIAHHKECPMECTNRWNGLRCKSYCNVRSICDEQ